MEETLKKLIEDLSSKASTTLKSEDAMRFSQAAVNLTQALCNLNYKAKNRD